MMVDDPRRDGAMRDWVSETRQLKKDPGIPLEEAPSQDETSVDFEEVGRRGGRLRHRTWEGE